MIRTVAAANYINWLMQCDFQMVTIQLVTSNQHENGVLVTCKLSYKTGGLHEKSHLKMKCNRNVYRQNMWNVFQLLKSYLMNRKSNVLLTDPDGPFELTQ